jgi:hypothetical protein
LSKEEPLKLKVKQGRKTSQEPVNHNPCLNACVHYLHVCGKPSPKTTSAKRKLHQNLFNPLLHAAQVQQACSRTMWKLLYKPHVREWKKLLEKPFLTRHIMWKTRKLR